MQRGSPEDAAMDGSAKCSGAGFRDPLKRSCWRARQQRLLRLHVRGRQALEAEQGQIDGVHHAASLHGRRCGEPRAGLWIGVWGQISSGGRPMGFAPPAYSSRLITLDFSRSAIASNAVM
jgi:hypothetical protein